MKTVLLNDTRSDQHIGCELVVTNTLRKCKEYNLDIISTITTSEAAKACSILEEKLYETDLVLLNGEGTLHDDKPNAIELLKAAKLAKEHGCRVVLYNALWANNPTGKNYLKYFDLIFCRDLTSLDSVLTDCPDAKAQCVPDMTFATQLPDTAGTERNGTLVSDSVRKQKCISLTKLALKQNWHFAPMSTAFFRKLKRKPFLKWRISRKLTKGVGEIDTPVEFLTKLQNAESVVTGRFHTACLSLVCSTPVYCISSNTKKIQSLFSDFGLDCTSIHSEIPSILVMEKQWNEQRTKQDLIKQRVSEASSLIDNMFQKISSLA